MNQIAKKKSIVPGFRLTLGVTLFYLVLMVIIPLAGLVFKTSTLSWDQLWRTISSPRVLAAVRLSVGAAMAAALVNAVFGTLLAWVLTRYKFPGRSLVDALVDLPVALPTAVAGLALTAIYSDHGLIGRIAESFARMKPPKSRQLLHAPFPNPAGRVEQFAPETECRQRSMR